MNKFLPYIFLVVLGGSIAFMLFYMNDLAKLGNTTSVSQDVAE